MSTPSPDWTRLIWSHSLITHQAVCSCWLPGRTGRCPCTCTQEKRFKLLENVQLSAWKPASLSDQYCQTHRWSASLWCSIQNEAGVIWYTLSLLIRPCASNCPVSQGAPRGTFNINSNFLSLPYLRECLQPASLQCNPGLQKTSAALLAKQRGVINILSWMSLLLCQWARAKAHVIFWAAALIHFFSWLSGLFVLVCIIHVPSMTFGGCMMSLADCWLINHWISRNWTETESSGFRQYFSLGNSQETGTKNDKLLTFADNFSVSPPWNTA